MPLSTTEDSSTPSNEAKVGVTQQRVGCAYDIIRKAVLTTFPWAYADVMCISFQR